MSQQDFLVYPAEERVDDALYWDRVVLTLEL